MRHLILLGCIFLGLMGRVVADETDNTLSLEVRGEASAISSQVTLEFLVRTSSTEDDATTVEKRFTTRMERIRQDLLGLAPISSLNLQVALGAFQIHSFTAKLDHGGWAQQPGITYSQKISIELRNLDLRQKLVRKDIVRFLESLADQNLIGTADDIDILSINFGINSEQLRQEAYQKAMTQAQQRAKILARLGGRTLGKVIMIREIKNECDNTRSQAIGLNFCHLVFPNKPQWMVDPQVTAEVELLIVYQLN